jgi:hypothetical protein
MQRALVAVEQLWNRRGGLALGLFTHSLRHAPGVARWAYRRRTRARGRPL